MSRDPRIVERWLAVAAEAHRAGRLDAASRRYDRVLRTLPVHPDALHLKGLALYQQGQAAAALALIDQALAVAGDRADIHANRALVLQALDDAAAARAAFETALRLAPDDPSFALRLARFDAHHGRHELALATLRRAAGQAPERAEIWTALAAAARVAGPADEAVAAAQRAVALAPGSPAALSELAQAVGLAGQPEDAVATYRAALAAGADAPTLWNNLGNCLRELGDLDAAIASFEACLARAPDHAAARATLGTCLLMRGDPRGWAAYEARLALPGQPAPVAPRWDGAPLAGTLLVRAEQGLGDVLQFVRFLPLARARVGRLALAVPPVLAALLAGLDGVDALVPYGAAVAPPDAEAALLSLPGCLGIDPWAPPAPVPYLAADPQRLRRWAAWLDDAAPAGLRVGVAWQGSVGGAVDRGRSIPAAALLPLAAIPGVRLVALQRGPGLEQAAALPPGSLAVPGPEFDGDGAFLDSAALLQALDLLVAPDTAIGHLAGALGRPAWIALKPAPHWPWRLAGDRTPWYPTLRLYRRAAAEPDWGPVVARMAADLAALAAG